MKTRKLYQVRFEQGSGLSTKQVGHKMRLLERTKASRIVKRLKRAGVDAIMVPMLIAA